MWTAHGGGACGALIRSIDWAKTPIGPIESWPRSLLTIVRVMLHSRHPMFLWWGPELIQLYNDAYTPSFGRGKHPAAMGQRGRDCWQEIWPIIGPQIEGVMQCGESTWHEDALVPIFRNGGIEEVYWTYGYSPVYDEAGGVGGTLVVCNETTARVIATRRQALFRGLAEQASALDTPREVIGKALATFAESPEDIPFVAWFDAAGALQQAAGLDGAAASVVAACARRIAAHPVHGARGPHGPPAAATHVVLDLPLAVGPWPEPVREAFAVPGLGGFVVFGLSSRLPFDAAYRDFLIQLMEAARLAHDRSEAFAVRAAAESERREQLLQTPVPTALLIGPDHVFELANREFVAMAGREVLGKRYLDAFPERAGTAMPSILDGVYRSGVPFVADELGVPMMRGGAPQDCYFKLSLQPIRDAGGAIYGMMVIAIEITEIVRARDERTALIADLEAANEAKDEFLALLGHELRNSLAPIATALDLVRARTHNAFWREHEVIARHATHLGRLVDDLLDVSRIARGKLELRREQVAIGDVVAKATEMAGPLIERREHRLTVDVPHEPIQWWGDPMRLAQVIANLLTNAARYTEPRGEIRIAVARAAASVEISVADNGTGIPPELMPRIFDRFVQGQRPGERTQGGLGIGLTLVKSLVELHSGTVAAHSAGAGKGSRFVVSLPLASLPVAAASASPDAPAARRIGKRVLVVDDNVDAANLMAELLRVRGHDVEVAYDAPSALEVLPRFQPEVAVFDIGLPEIDGYELAHRVSTTDRTGCRLIAVTGYGQERDSERARQAGFHRHLVKPVKLDVLLEAIAEA